MHTCTPTNSCKFDSLTNYIILVVTVPRTSSFGGNCKLDEDANDDTEDKTLILLKLAWKAIAINIIMIRK